MNFIKKLVLVAFLPIFLSVTSCATNKNLSDSYDMKLSDVELNKFSKRGITIYYESEKIAVVQSTELEYNPNDGNIIKEISITQTNPYDDEMTAKIIKYIHHLHPNAKIEVNFF